MGKRKGQRMSFDDAMDLADSMDLPDGAFWAMAHELSGLEYGDGFDQIAADKSHIAPPAKAHAAPAGGRPLRHCDMCQRSFKHRGDLQQHKRDKHGMQWRPKKEG